MCDFFNPLPLFLSPNPWPIILTLGQFYPYLSILLQYNHQCIWISSFIKLFGYHPSLNPFNPLYFLFNFCDWELSNISLCCESHCYHHYHNKPLKQCIRIFYFMGWMPFIVYTVYKEFLLQCKGVVGIYGVTLFYLLRP